MNTQNKLINDILSTYNNILENRRIIEAADVYDNVDLIDNSKAGYYPSRDNINTVLLQDIETAAKAAGVKVDITTAVSGHDKGTRHEKGNAVDIAIINGRSVSPSNREDADKLVKALVRMGYVKNKENKSIPKSVLTFGVAGHDNHVHISNTTQSPSNTIDQSSGEDSSGEDSLSQNYSIIPSDPLISAIGGSLIDFLKIKENIKRIKGLL